MAIISNFFDKNGGVSSGIYASLNCGIGSNDDKQNVLKNKQIIAEYFGLGSENLCTLYQIHSPHVVTLHAAMPPQIRPQADAMVTKEKNIILGILTADCAPVLFYDEINEVIGAAHAGWKGAISGVIKNTVNAMIHLGAKLENIKSIIGPCIGQNSYQVGVEFKANFCEKSAENNRFFIENENGIYFNLKEFVAQQITLTGANSPQINGDDTCAMPDKYFSYRRKTLLDEPDYGRQISCICIK